MIVSYIIFFVFRHFKRKKTLSRNRQIAFLCRVKYLRKITGVNKREKGCRYKKKKKQIGKKEQDEEYKCVRRVTCSMSYETFLVSMCVVYAAEER